MKIGITCADESKIWNNGLHQNAYNLFDLYKKAKLDVHLVSQKIDSKTIFEKNIVFLNKETIKNFDIILEVSESLTDEFYNYLIEKGKKVVSINYGNLLMIFNEDLITNKDSYFCFSREGVENWYSPHFYFAEGLIKVTSKKEGRMCPYIWTPEFLLKSSAKNNFNILEASKELDIRKIGILEPNINIIKNCIYPIIGCEILEQKNSNKLSEVMVFSSDGLKKSKSFLEHIKKFEMLQNKKISFESRYSFPFLIKNKYFGTIVSNNIYNDLNYLTLEALFLNMPIIHNSHLCKEAGFFYSDPFNGSEISNQIENAIDNFSSSKKEYQEKAENIIWKFSPNNPDNIKKYEELINSVS